MCWNRENIYIRVATAAIIIINNASYNNNSTYTCNVYVCVFEEV